MRVGGARCRQRNFWLVMCYGFFVAVAALYLQHRPGLHSASRCVAVGQTAPYATVLVDDARFIQQGVFSALVGCIVSLCISCANMTAWFHRWRLLDPARRFPVPSSACGSRMLSTC